MAPGAGSHDYEGRRSGAPWPRRLTGAPVAEARGAPLLVPTGARAGSRGTSKYLVGASPDRCPGDLKSI